MKLRELTEKIIGCAYRVLMAVCLSIALFAGSGSVRGQGSGVGRESEVGSQRSEIRGQEFCEESLQKAASMEERFEYFNDFIVYMKDDRRRDRLLVCDVVIELNRGIKLPQERIELRKIIYNTLKEPSDLYEIRRSLKKEIKIRLNNFMNDKIIKGVYFTKFVLL